MNFSNPAVDKVFAEYEKRNSEERKRIIWPTWAADLSAHRDEFLLPVGREVGWFLHSLILAKRPARVLELGTSYGYSTLFLADAVTQIGGKLITMDLADYKQAAARAMIDKAGLSAVVDFRLGDAVVLINADAGPFDLVLLDIWKDLYIPCLARLLSRLADEGIIAADNMIPEPAMVRADVQKIPRRCRLPSRHANDAPADRQRD